MDKKLLKDAFSYKAEAKNVRNNYPSDDKIDDIIATISELGKVSPATPYITANNVAYDTDKYLVPKNVLVVINACRVYANANSSFKEPVLEGKFETSGKGKVLEPAEFNAIFSIWNSNQYNYKLELVPVERKICTLMDVGAVLRDEKILTLNDQAYISEFAASALKLQCDLFNEKNSVCDTVVSEMEVAEWVLSN